DSAQHAAGWATMSTPASDQRHLRTMEPLVGSGPIRRGFGRAVKRVITSQSAPSQWPRPNHRATAPTRLETVSTLCRSPSGRLWIALGDRGSAVGFLPAGYASARSLEP